MTLPAFDKARILAESCSETNHASFQSDLMNQATMETQTARVNEAVTEDLNPYHIAQQQFDAGPSIFRGLRLASSTI